ncbi:MAG: hypothetical protein AAGC95_04680 [Pseudomonadota bacterium]
MNGRLLALLLLFAPIVIYVAMQWIRARGGDDEIEILTSQKALILAAVGVGLAGVTLIVFGLSERSGVDGYYKPAEYVDGELVPGRIE